MEAKAKTATKTATTDKKDTKATKTTTAKNDTKADATKSTTKLAPVKPKGKTGEPEKRTGKKEPTLIGKGKGKNVKKEPEKELYLRFGKKVLNYLGEEQDLDENKFLKYNVIGVLFTGSWVPPAKEFMKKLEDLYAEVNKNMKDFEIVQVPNEKTEQAYKESMTEKRNWLYLPFNDHYIKTLVETFNVEYLPTLKIINRDFFVLSENGRKDMIDNEGTKAWDKWYKAYRDRKNALEKEREEKEEQLNRADA